VEENTNEMMQTATKPSNPLAQFYRQPKIYIKLPSQGRFYPNGTLDVSSNEEYPVFAMTAKDELMFKTPDALLSGQSTVEIIKSCIPAIKDPWQMPTIDLDFCLMAIRVATYGSDMEINATCPRCGDNNPYLLNLTDWMGKFGTFQYQDTVNVDPLVVKIRPYSYKEMTKTTLKTLHQQKLVNIASNDEMSDEEKMDKFNQGFIQLTALTVEVIADCIVKIETPDGPSTDKAQIKDFINNCSSEVFDKISKHIQNIKTQIELPPQHVKCTGCENEYDVPIAMDQSNFFGARS
jgi:hypothetical protein